MSENLRKFLPLLQLISNISDKKLQKQLLKYYSKDKKFYKALSEISKNIIKGNVKLTKYKKNKLIKYKKNIYSIAFEKNSPINKRKIRTVQTGGWLWIIPIVASLLK